MAIPGLLHVTADAAAGLVRFFVPPNAIARAAASARVTQ